MIDFSYSIEGLKELNKALDELPKATARSLLRQSLTRAAKPVLKEARARVPVRTGGLRDSLIVSSQLASKRQQRLQRREGNAVVFVGATWPQGAHAHLVEYGTKAHTIKVKRKKVLSDGRTVFGTEIIRSASSPRPFLRPAFDSTFPEFRRTFTAEMLKRLERTAARFERQARAGKLSKSARKFFAGIR